METDCQDSNPDSAMWWWVSPYPLSASGALPATWEQEYSLGLNEFIFVNHLEQSLFRFIFKLEYSF